MIHFYCPSVRIALYGCSELSQYIFQNKENKELNTFSPPVGVAEERIYTAKVIDR